MTYIPTHLKVRHHNISKEIHNILFNYFSNEIEYILNYHSHWLKYPINENNNIFYIICKENDRKIQWFIEDFKQFILLEKKFLNNKDNIDGVIYTLKLYE